MSASRIHHLDSLRGVASVMVVLHHSFLSYKGIPYHDMAGSLLGKSAILFFFLLSGYVLSRSLLKSQVITCNGLSGYYLRRFFRIYPAVLASILFASIAAKFYNDKTLLEGGSDWLKGSMEGALTVKSISAYCREILIYSNQLNNPLWTIRAELAASFLLPFLLILLRILPKFEFFVVIIMGVVLWLGDTNRLWCYWIGYQYIFTFYIGSLLASDTELIAKITERQTKVILVLGVLLLLMSTRRDLDSVSGSLILASIFALLIPCNWPRLYNLLNSKPLLYLGKISFSLYLLHLPLLLLSYRLLTRVDPVNIANLHPVLSSFALFIMTMLAAIPLATFSEKLVEAPFNSMGHRLSARLSIKKT